MRRKDKEITDIQQILEIVSKLKVCRMAMSDKGMPYVLPLNYGYEYTDGKLIIYMHGSNDGRKMAVLKENPNVCIEMDGGHELISADEPCHFSYAFESIIGFGKVEFAQRDEDKKYMLNQIMKHQTGKDISYDFAPPMLKMTAVYKVIMEELTGKAKLI